MALHLAVVFAMEVAFIMVFALPRVLLVDIKIGKTSFFNLMFWVGVPMYIDMLNTLLLSREEYATEDLGRPVFQAGPLLNFLNIFLLFLCAWEPRKHQIELNISLINPAGEHCFVVARERNCGSTTNIYCRIIDNSGSGVGKPFQLRRSENTSFWTNEDVENEGIKVGCVVEYRGLTCYQSPLGRYCKLVKRDGKQFIFRRNDRKRLLVSF